MNAIAQQELAKQYRGALDRFNSYFEAVRTIVKDDFPSKSADGVTRYHVDALNDLTQRLAALVEGYESRH